MTTRGKYQFKRVSQSGIPNFRISLGRKNWFLLLGKYSLVPVFIGFRNPLPGIGKFKVVREVGYVCYQMGLL